jgi:tetratricopeptide (TPR) repeat protein
LDLAGAYALQLGDYPETRRLQEAALSIFRKCGSPVQIAYTLFHLGHLSGFVQDDYPTARDFYEEGLNKLREAGHKEGIIHGMANLGTALAGMGEPAQAASLIADSLQGYYEMNSLFNIELSLWRAAAVAASLDLPEIALQLTGASEHHRLALGVSEPNVFLQAYARMLAPARRRLDETSQARLQAEGATWSFDEAVAVALKMLLEVRDEI